MTTMNTLSETLNMLKNEGYTVDFNLQDNCLICKENALNIHPEEFKVDKFFRFEGPSDPADSAIVYAISSSKYNLKGVLVNGYGISGDVLTNEMVKALSGLAGRNGSSNVQSTALRPEGSRTLNADLQHTNLQEAISQIKEEKAWQNGDRNAITIYKTGNMRIVLIALHKNTEMKTHTAPGNISVQLLEGQINFSALQQETKMQAGELLTLQANVPHSVFAAEESVFLLTMCVGNA